MTALCGGGTSSAKPLAPAVVFLTGETITAVLTEGLGTPVWADLVVYAASQSFTLSSFCTTDPPAVPTFSVADVLDIVQLNVFQPGGGYTKLVQLIAVAAWYVFCQCDSGSPPTPVVPPTRPAGGAVVNPPAAGQLGAAPCWDVANTIVHPASGGVTEYDDWTNSFLPGALVSGMTGNGGITHAVLVPAGASGLHMVGTVLHPGETIQSNFQLQFYDSTKAAIAGGTNSFNITGSPYDSHPAIPTNAVYWSIATIQAAAQPKFTCSFEVSFFCSAPGAATPNTPCCPPDPTLVGRLERIEKMLTSIYQSIPTNLTSYAESTVHAGLINGGTVLLGSGVIGVKVAITTDNATLGSLPGDPTYLLNRGYIVPIAIEGPIRGQTRLVYNPQLYQLPPLADSIGYQLGAGVTASITELVRGP